MTRITNFGRKRTYLEAGIATEAVESSHNEEGNPVQETGFVNPSDAPPPKKKRKRTKPSKRDNYVPPVKEDSAEGAGGEKKPLNGPKNKKNAKSKSKSKAKDPRKIASESRRLKRISDKLAETTCFACREKGHAARDCPKNEQDGTQGSKVGICYRCGSNRHTLSRCKKPVVESNPLPFASCFVCSGQGHLASGCPQNKAKGVYPNGGCCKLCGDTTHLAKECGLRRQDTVKPTLVLGLDQDLGADEDDFHSFKRRKTEVDKSEQRDVKQMGQVKMGVMSGVFTAAPARAGPPQRQKNVVYF